MAQKINIVIDQGATFSLPMSFIDDDSNTGIDFTTFTANSVLRKTYTSSNSVAFSVSMSNAGVVTLGMTANTTATIEAGRYVYDVEVTDTYGSKSRLVEGIATVTPRVT